MYYTTLPFFFFLSFFLGVEGCGGEGGVLMLDKLSHTYIHTYTYPYTKRAHMCLESPRDGRERVASQQLV